MAPIAIAGGSSFALGRSIVHGLLSQTPHHHPIILTRPSTKVPDWLAPLVSDGKVSVRKVDYTSHESMVKALSGVHTVLSCILVPDQTWPQVQIGLLKAAVEAGAKRFSPAEYGLGALATPKMPMLSPTMEVWEACEESGLEWTRFHNGMFMNYLGFGSVRDQEEALASRGNERSFLIDTVKCEAELPVDEKGQIVTLTMTETMDVGKFVARACDLDKWTDTDMDFAGDTLRLDEMVETIARITGKKYKITTITADDIRAKLDKESDVIAAMWLGFGLICSHNAIGEGIMSGKLNKLFPDVETMTVEKYARRYLV
ncbi:MAG: hypothetical protein M1814_004506 [Vezdaea aestivalis]|nr:MAG: hypothetical protein M1814_004506 [Vezdaea aestivalis]